MSWSGFKKNVGRATTQVMMKTGHVEKTSDRSYEVEERRYRTLESASLRLQKEAKGYLDSLRAMTASQMRIAETIDAFYGDSGAQDGVSRSYKQAVEDLDAETVKALDGPYRCVPDSLYKFAGDDVEVLHQIGLEWNFQAGNRRNFTRNAMAGLEEQCELMEYVYRTTVLEPINRFCNYFPDINECIKKRQHKMLDYDALRAKVKKLTEKPDKDPGKLPRTEKETEMVGLYGLLYNDPFNAYTSAAKNGSTYDGGHDYESDPAELEVPTPPKALQRPEIERLRRELAQTPARASSTQTGRSPNMMSNATRADLVRLDIASEAAKLQRSSSMADQTCAASTNASGLCGGSSASPTRVLHNTHRSQLSRSVSMPSASPPSVTAPFPPTNEGGFNDVSPSKKKTSSMASSRSSLGRSDSLDRLPTPFLQPSELEQLMQPLKQEFIQKQADIYVQAKAAYEQLNEQLTSELPQLIDLRVPYLDPSFEALVKIQLRFCAEAYSRMAQVQQYLDASTRDQYASGDLDARVEDVLGQIRELSIAGTV